MANIVAELKAMEGPEFTLVDLRTRFRRARVNLLGTLPPDMDTKGLIAWSLENGWITETEEGRFRIEVPRLRLVR